MAAFLAGLPQPLMGLLAAPAAGGIVPVGELGLALGIELPFIFRYLWNFGRRKWAS